MNFNEETFSTLSVLSRTMDLKIHNTRTLCDTSKIRRLTVNDKILYNENDIINQYGAREAYLYIRIDSEDMMPDLDEIKKEIPRHNISIGISERDKVNDQLVELLRMCMTRDVRSIMFYKKSDTSREILRIIVIISKLTNVELSYYLN